MILDIVTTIELTDDDIEDIMVTALEGGIGYWSCFDNTTKDFDEQAKLCDEHEPVSIIATKMLLNGKSLIFEDVESPDRWKLTLDKLKKGIVQYCKERGNIRTALDEGMYDADESDCTIQYALFGEIVFG